MVKLPTSLLPRRTTTTSHLNLLSSSSRPTTTTPSQPTPSHNCTQVRHATKVQRPIRPYTFTQVIQLSDGSTYMNRTTSPHSLYKSTKDSRNHLLWQPHEKSLRNVEIDEAGRLAAFRSRFGSSYEIQYNAPAPAPAAAAAVKQDTKTAGKKGAAAAKPVEQEVASAEEDPMDVFGDLISGYAREDPNIKGGGLSAKDQAKKDKKGKKK